MAKRPKPVPQMTVAQFEATFPDETACASYLVAERCSLRPLQQRQGFPGLFDAVQMAVLQVRDHEGRGLPLLPYRGHNTNKPLRDWFRVVHLMLASKKGMSALQIQRIMGFGSYGTAHSMCHKIRAALIEPEAKLGGIVEVDETWIGGKDKNRHWDKKVHVRGGAGSGKAPIIGAVSRKGNVITRVLQKVTREAAERFIREAVSEKVSLQRMKAALIANCRASRIRP